MNTERTEAPAPAPAPAPTRSTRRTVLLTLGIAFAFVILVAALFIFSGIYDISARSPHNFVTLSILDATMEQSVRHHARGIQVPKLASTTEGFEHYNEMCVMCHGAPGVQPDYIGKGLYPNGPYLPEAIDDWSDAELFWIIKNGIKMTGMPAFGVTQSDEQIWAITGFVRGLGKISEKEYKELAEHHHADEGTMPRAH